MCVPSAGQREPNNEALVSAGNGYRGRFATAKAMLRHGRSCGAPAANVGVYRVCGLWYCCSCSPQGCALPPHGFIERAVALRHARLCPGVGGDALESDFWAIARCSGDPPLRQTAPVERLDTKAPIGGCAACGIILIGEPPGCHRVDHKNSQDAFMMAGLPRPFSSRGAGGLCLIKGLVHYGGYDLCGACESGFKNGSRRETDLDLGDVSHLPCLTLVERAAIAHARVYGTLVKVSAGGAESAKLSGHCISFNQDVRQTAGMIFPRDDIADVIRVQFIGGIAEWNAAIPLLKLRGVGELSLRTDVVCQWLLFLKGTHPLYMDAIIDTSTERAAIVEASVERIILNAVVSDDIATGVVDRAMQSDIAAAEAPESGGLQMSHTVVENQSALHNEAKRMAELRAFVRVAAALAPISEFDENDHILGGAFPWVFPFGRVGRVTHDRRRTLMMQFDKRISEEPMLIFLLFNQMQRHRVSHNIARSTQEQLDKLEELRASDGFEALVLDATSEKPSADGARLRKTLLAALHHGEKRVPFSRSEMDGAYIELLGLLRFFGSPTVFLTCSPSVVDNAFGLKIVSGSGEAAAAEYDVRSKLVFGSPARAAIYFETIMDHIENTIVRVGGVDVGVFGRVRAYSRSNECQGRTLLHAHMLIWVDISPEIVQQTYRSGNGEMMSAICKFMEEICVTNMSKGFWEYSNRMWRERVRPAHPGLGDVPKDQDAWYNLVHTNELHRQHKPTCWAKYAGREKPTDRCRMCFPAGPWEHETQLVQLVVGVGGVPAANKCPDPASIPCAHVIECTCRTPSDLVAVSKGGPCVVEMYREHGDNQLLASFTPECLLQTCSNTQTGIISTAEQAAAIALYEIKYVTKGKTVLTNALACIVAARRRAGESTNPSERTFFNNFVNALASDHEVPATMAAFALLGGRGFSTSCQFWYIFPWDAIDTSALRAKMRVLASGARLGGAAGADGGLGSDDGESCSDDGEHFGDEHAQETGTGCNDVLEQNHYTSDKVPEANQASTGHRVFPVGTKNHAVPQDVIYANRPASLGPMCLLAFSCMYDVEEVEKEGARKKSYRNERCDFREGFVLNGSWRLRRRGVIPVPVLAGNAPPNFPVGHDTPYGRSQLEAWAAYWAVLLVPWRVAADLEPHTAESMVAWLLSSLRGEGGRNEKQKAMFVVNCSFKWKQVKKHCLIIDAYRFRAAETREAASMSGGGGGGARAEDDGAKAISSADLLKSVFRFAAAGGFENESIRRRGEQIEALLSHVAPGGAARLAYRAVPVEDADRVSKAIAAFDALQFDEDNRSDGCCSTGQAPCVTPAPAQRPDILPDESLTVCQNKLRLQVLGALAAGTQRLVFVQGPAGTGKSKVIERVAEEAGRMRLDPGREPPTARMVRCLTPTGVAAGNLIKGTQTIHKGLGINPKIKGRLEDLSGDKRGEFLRKYAGARVFIIDEISMVSPSLFDKVDGRLRMLAREEARVLVRKGYHHEAAQISDTHWFGGFTVIIAGDFRQIPPVGSHSLMREALRPSAGVKGKGGYLFRRFSFLPFETQCRANEPVQLARVSALRCGEITRGLLDGIARLTLEDAAGAFANATFIVTTNGERHAINDLCAVSFAKGAGVPVIKFRNDMSPGVLSALSEDLITDLCVMQPDLHSTFVAGAPAMVLANVNPQCGLSNGSSCTMIGLAGLTEGDERIIGNALPGEVVWLKSPPKYVLVSVAALEDASVPRLLALGGVGALPCVPLPISSDEVAIGGRNVSYQSHHVSLAFAVTMHKVQGKTLEKAVIALSNHGGRWKPTFEQLLVAITRVRNADDLRILPSLSLSDAHFYSLCDLKPDQYVTEWLAGHFDSEGMRHYDSVPEKAKKTPSKAAAKTSKSTGPSVVDGGLPGIRLRGPEAEPSQRAAPRRRTEGAPAPCDGGAGLPEGLLNLVAFGAVQGLAAEAGEMMGELRTPGAFINESVIEAVASHVLVGAGSEMVFVERAALGRRCVDMTTRYVSYVAYSAHFVAIMIDCPNGILHYAETLGARLISAERDSILAGVALSFCGRQLELRRTVVEFQVENECAIAAVNNILMFACPRLRAKFTRATMAVVVQKLFGLPSFAGRR